MNNATISRVGIILFALVFAFFGVNHFRNADAMSGFVPAYMPGSGKFWVYFTGACMIAAALCFLAGKYVKIAGLLLSLMLLVFVFMLHLPSVLDGNDAALPSLLKDLALAGASLMIAGSSK